MQVDIRNLYYLLSYAWDHLEALDLVDVALLTGASPAELLARMLVEGTRRQIRRGLQRGYVPRSEITATPRGKIDIAGSLRRVGRGTPTVVCSPDELTHDVPQNRILKATLRTLARIDTIAAPLRQELFRLAENFRGVADVELHVTAFHALHVQRQKAGYRFLMHVCELIARSILIKRGTGRHRFYDFTGDEREFGLLFEAFVRNFWRKHRPELNVGARKISWDATGDVASLALLPEMRTDISFATPTVQGIVETKCVAQPLERGAYGPRKLRARHLYQVLAYLTNLRRIDGCRASAMLLYCCRAYGSAEIGAARPALELIGLPTRAGDQPCSFGLGLVFFDLVLAAFASRFEAASSDSRSL